MRLDTEVTSPQSLSPSAKSPLARVKKTAQDVAVTVRTTLASWRDAVHRRYRSLMLGLGERCYRSPWAAVAPWVGTLAGGWVVGANAGDLPTIALGIIFAGVGCFPVGAGAYWANEDRSLDERREARERKVLAYVSTTLLPELGRTTMLRRPGREDARDLMSRATVDYLGAEVYGAPNSLRGRKRATARVVLYKVSDDGSQLSPFHQAGRDDPATSFTAGDGGVGDKAFSELFSDPVFETNLVGRGYQTYISAPILGNDIAFGMLTVDTTQLEEIDDEDRDAIETVAAALAVFFVEAERDRRTKR